MVTKYYVQRTVYTGDSETTEFYIAASQYFCIFYAFTGCVLIPHGRSLETLYRYLY